MKVSIVLPCRNEEAALPSCIRQIRETMGGADYEIVVSDSSTDRSPSIAGEMGAKLVKHDLPGYGNAIIEGVKASKGDYIFIADADCSYDFREIPRFVKALDDGYDLVIGDRFRGGIGPGAMPWHHRYVGNPVLSAMLRLFFRTRVRDIHCGMRALTRKAFDRLNLRTTGMEFASEMVIQAAKRRLRIRELPIVYHRRVGASKLHSFTDGWRHMRFMLLYSPMFLFFFPGLLLFAAGLASGGFLYSSEPQLFGLQFFYHPMFVSSLFVIVGYQLVIFAIFAKTYAITHLGEENAALDSLYGHFTIERAIAAGAVLTALGLAIFGSIFYTWLRSGYGGIQEVKNSIVALTLLVCGIQTVSSSFMLSILGIKER